eukprot:scaffold5088_cov98-Cylindrotheca_fusiformis.AAC.2
MRNLTPQNSPTKVPKPAATGSSKQSEGEKKAPDWMVRLQQKKKETKAPNRDEVLFPTFEGKPEILYIDDEDDVAQSYFPEAKFNGNSSSSTLQSSSESTEATATRRVSGYNFDALLG